MLSLPAWPPFSVEECISLRMVGTSDIGTTLLHTGAPCAIKIRHNSHIITIFVGEYLVINMVEKCLPLLFVIKLLHLPLIILFIVLLGMFGTNMSWNSAIQLKFNNLFVHIIIHHRQPKRKRRPKSRTKTMQN